MQAKKRSWTSYTQEISTFKYSAWLPNSVNVLIWSVMTTRVLQAEEEEFNSARWYFHGTPERQSSLSSQCSLEKQKEQELNWKAITA